ncbi:MAG: T9SS type A sorting domain-containing protein [Bacteroidota bacterium]
MRSYLSCGILVLSCLSTSLFAQLYIPPNSCFPRHQNATVNAACLQGTSSTLPNNNVAAQFNRVHDQSHWLSFYFFDDGYFSLNANPSHEFAARNLGNNQFNVHAYSGGDYRPSRPKLLHNPVTVTTPALSLTTPPSFKVAPGVNIISSWAPIDDSEIIHIITIAHPSPGSTAKYHGTVRIDFPGAGTNITAYDPSNRPANWASLGIVSGRSVEWNFSDLRDGEVRYLYTTTTIPLGSIGLDLDANVTMNAYDDNMNPFVSTATYSKKVQKPRDPNYILPDYEFMAADHTDQQQIRYDVGFHNNGNDYIKDVYVDITLDPSQHILPTVNLIKSSHATSISFIQPDVVRFYFSDIYLAGTNQPPCAPGTPTPQGAPDCNQIFGWEDVSSTFSFSVCTGDRLPPGQLVAGMEVTFVGVSTVPASPAITTLEPPMPIAPECGTPYDDQEEQDGGIEGLSTTNIGTTYTSSAPIQSAVYPNPFNGQFTIAYHVTAATAEEVNISLWNVAGQQVAVLFDDRQYEGYYNYQYDAQNLEAGIYFLRIQKGADTEMKRIVKAR